MQETNQKQFTIAKIVKREGNKLYVKCKDYDNCFNNWVDKKTLYKIIHYFHKAYRAFGGNINFKVDLSNYATKADLKNATIIDTSNFARKSNSVSLKIELDKLNNDKSKPISTDLS